MGLFDTALEREDFDQAAGYLGRIRALHPDSPALAVGEQRLVVAEQAQLEQHSESEAA